jgi:hypothetical protein
LKLELAIKTLGGRHWKDIVPQFFPGRSRLDLSNRYVDSHDHMTLFDSLISYTMLQRKKRLGHRRNYSNATNETSEAIRSVSSSPAAESSGTSQLSPLTERSDDGLPSGAVMRWNTALDQHVYTTMDTGMPHIASTDMQPSDHSLQTSHYDAPDVKVENWCTPVPMSSEHNSPLIQHQHHQSMEMYQQYPQWTEDWTEPKTVMPEHSVAAFEASYVAHESFHIESHGDMDEDEPVNQKMRHRRTITLDNVDPSTRAVILDALCKDKKQLTVVFD